MTPRHLPQDRRDTTRLGVGSTKARENDPGRRLHNSGSHLEATLIYQIRMAGLPEPKREFKAITGRRYRWDFAWPDHKLLVEVQGGIWRKGGHSTGTGITRDAEKLNLASLAGYRSLAFTAEQIRDGRALAWLQQFFREAA